MGLFFRQLGLWAAVFALPFTASITSGLARAEILHLELGVANYGPANGTSSNRFKVMDETLSDLVARYGSFGTIYLNDINPEGLNLSVEHANAWLKALILII